MENITSARAKMTKTLLRHWNGCCTDRPIWGDGMNIDIQEHTSLSMIWCNISLIPVPISGLYLPYMGWPKSSALHQCRTFNTSLITLNFPGLLEKELCDSCVVQRQGLTNKLRSTNNIKYKTFITRTGNESRLVVVITSYTWEFES
jgi:hypothetical protein